MLNPPSDRLVIRLVIGTLSLVAIAALAVMSALALQRHAIPQQLNGAFTFAIGAIAGVLARTSSSPDVKPAALDAPANVPADAPVVDAPAVVVAPPPSP